MATTEFVSWRGAKNQAWGAYIYKQTSRALEWEESRGHMLGAGPVSSCTGLPPLEPPMAACSGEVENVSGQYLIIDNYRVAFLKLMTMHEVVNSQFTFIVYNFRSRTAFGKLKIWIVLDRIKASESELC